jgi:phytanoyl-CoA hydroxylase
MLSLEQVNHFHRHGYLKLEQFCPTQLWQSMLATSLQHLQQRVAPYELESELQYPGAPAQNAQGSETIRRLKQAFDRDRVFAEWATHQTLSTVLSALMPQRYQKYPNYLVRAHHNCIMTKQPTFSSDSWWHQDLRYWRYTDGELISAWLALGNERPDNGCLQVIPASHRLSFNNEQFDDELFFRQDLSQNKALLKQAQYIELNAGDVVLFHCRLLHAATRNHTNQRKLAVVFTYRNQLDAPIEGSRSASLPDKRLPTADQNTLSRV